MVKLAAALLITTLVLAVVAVAALSSEPAAASEIAAAPGGAEPAPPAQVGGETEDGEDSDVSEVHEFAFIGVGIATLTSAEADELGIAGGVRVREVVEDGPSAGVLEVGDVIIAVNGEAVGTASELAERVRAATVGEPLTLTVIRGDDTLFLEVTPIAREARIEKHTFRVEKHLLGPTGPANRILNALQGLHGEIVKLELVLKTDEGTKTVRVLSGTISNLDPERLSFTLDLSDDSGSVDLQGNDDTVVITGRTGDFGGLNEQDSTFAVEWDGELELVVQGEEALGGNPLRLESLLPNLKGFAPHLGEGFLEGLPDLIERFDGLPADLRERLEGLLEGHDDEFGETDDGGCLSLQ